jgi:hypothetical protein
MTDVAKAIDLVGSFDKCWHALDMTAKVDPNGGDITEYHTAVKIAFGVEH